MVSASRAWCSASRRSQKVVVKEVAKLPAVMRRKFDKPDAAGILCCGRPSKITASRETKNSPMANPWTSCGATNAKKLASVVRPARMKYETAKKPKEEA